MLANYLKITLRNLIKHKGYSFINIFGLAIGMACTILIFLWVQDELSYDRFHENAGNLYRVEKERKLSSGVVHHTSTTPFPMAPVLKEEIPEIIDAARFVNTAGLLVRYQEMVFYENKVKAVDPSFFRMFTFPFIQGGMNNVFNDPFSIVISGEMADKYFPDENPLGKAFLINKEYNLTVTGVIKNVPRNTYFQFDMLVPYELLQIQDKTNENWGSNSIPTFVQVHENINLKDVSRKITEIRNNQLAAVESIDKEVAFFVKPLTDIHLYSKSGFGKLTGNIQYIYIFSMIALFVLLIACINFMNLSTARSSNRAKEIGVRKVVGAVKSNIVKQFYSESVIFALLALIFSLLIVGIVLPFFNDISGKELSFNIINDAHVIFSLIGITLITGILAGSYPALFLSTFKPVKVLKGSLSSGAKHSSFRKILVVVQFTLSIFLIIGTGIVYNQLDYMKNKKLGYDKDNLIYIKLRGDTKNYYHTFKNELIKEPGILGVSGTSFLPSSFEGNSTDVQWEGKNPDERVSVNYIRVDFDYTETMGVELADGRSFSRDFKTDTTAAFLVNEELAKIMGMGSVVGKEFSFLGIDGKIVGVMKNFHYPSVKVNIRPIAIFASPSNIGYAFIRIKPENISKTIAQMKSTWEQVIPDYPFEYKFVDEDIGRRYMAEERMDALLKYFTVLAVLIASLGLFGLASYTAEQRTKEIGIRKVLGASSRSMLFLLCKEFLILVLAANIIAWPLAYFTMSNWLHKFAYRIDIGIGIFLISGISAVVIAIFTVGYRAIKTAIANPVEALRYE